MRRGQFGPIPSSLPVYLVKRRKTKGNGFDNGIVADSRVNVERDLRFVKRREGFVIYVSVVSRLVCGLFCPLDLI